MSNSHPAIVVDCERMKYPHTGLYQFCLHLSNALIETNTNQQLCFYTPPSAKTIFGTGQQYLTQHPLHKFSFPLLKNVSLWHCTYQGSAYFPFRKKVKKVLTLHDLNYIHDETKTGSKKKKFLAGVQRKIDASDAVVAISQFALTDAQAHLQLTGKPCSVIYNGCTIKEIASPATPAFAPQRPFLFSLGTITAKKNFHVLPRLLFNNDFLLVIAGITQSPAYKEKIRQEAMRLGVLDRVIFAGAVNETDKQWLLKNCSVFVFPSLAEGFGLPVVEAMYFGKPVLLSAAASLPEIGGGEACYFSSFGEEEMQRDLEVCLHRAQTDPSLKERLQQRARRFSWTEAALQYHRLYNELLEHRQ